MKRSLGSFAVLLGAEAISRLVAFLLGAVVARTLGLTVLSYLSLAQGLVAYVTVISDGGLSEHGVRKIVAGGSVRQTVLETSRAQGLLAIVGTAVLLLAVGSALPDAFSYVGMLVPVALMAAISTPYVLRGQHRIVPVGIARIAGATVTAGSGLAFIFLLPGSPAELIALSYSLGAIANAGVVQLFAGVGPASFLGPFSSRRALGLIRTALPLGLSGLLIQIYTSLPLLLTERLGAVDTFESMGLSTRLWFVAVAPAAMVGGVLVPLLADSATNSGVLLRFVIGAAASGGAVALVFGLWGTLLTGMIFGAEAASHGDSVSVFMSGALPYYIYAVLVSALIASGYYRGVLIGSTASLSGYLAFSLALGVGSPTAWPLSQLCGLLAISIVALRTVKYRKNSSQRLGAR